MGWPPPTANESDFLGFMSISYVPCAVDLPGSIAATFLVLREGRQEALSPSSEAHLKGSSCCASCLGGGMPENYLWESVGQKEENIPGGRRRGPTSRRVTLRPKWREVCGQRHPSSRVEEKGSMASVQGQLCHGWRHLCREEGRHHSSFSASVSWSGPNLIWFCPHQHVDWCGAVCLDKLASETLGPFAC